MERAIILKILVNGQKMMLISPVMNLKKAAGEHTEVKISGILYPEYSDQSNNIVPEVDMQIFDEGKDRMIFRGIIKAVDIDIETVNADPMKSIRLEAVSGTYLLDRKKRNRSFQKKSMKYKETAELSIRDYKDSGIMLSPELESLSIGRLIIQYQETDWQFVKRLMSRLNQPIIPDNKTQGSKFYAGIMESGKIYEIKPEEENKVSEFCYIEQGNEEGRLEYIWTSENPELDIMGVGDIIRYRMADYYIKSVEIIVKNSSICHRYHFCLKSGLRIVELQNAYITGLALPGSVKNVSGDQVQVKLDIDAVQETDCWYTYSTFYSTFYCMPEVGDRVHLFMPNNREEQAFVLNSIRDKPVGETSGGGKFDASSSSQEEIMNKENEKSENHETANILSWLQGVSGLQPAQVLGLELSASAASLEEPQTGGNGANNKNGGGSGASYSSNGAKTQTPSFDFQNLSGNEGTKVLSTKDGKMVILDDSKNSVSIVYSNGTNIVLDKEGLRINSDGLLNVTASGNINISTEGALNIVADEKVMIGCSGSSITLTPESVDIVGTDIKINE